MSALRVDGITPPTVLTPILIAPRYLLRVSTRPPLEFALRVYAPPSPLGTVRWCGDFLHPSLHHCP
jgi:hypothetical protein